MPELRDHQIDDLASFLANPKHLYRSEPGTQKTPVVITLQRHFWDTQGKRTVWLMPKSLMEKNYDEAMLWGYWDEGDVVIVDGTPKKVAAALASDAKVFIMGFARFKLSWRQLPPDCTIFHADEFHKGCGNDGSGVTQEMYLFMRERGTHFLPMTGTLVSGQPDTAYPALQVIEPAYYGSFKAFQAFHHLVDPFTRKRIGYKNLEILRSILDKHGVNRTFAEVHGQDTKPVIQLERLSMAPKQREIYEKLERDAIVELDRFFIDGTQPGTGFWRARQIMDTPNAFPDLLDPTGKAKCDIIPGERPGKIDALESHLQEHFERGTPVIVFAFLKEQQRQILELAKSIGLRAALIGDMNGKERAANDAAFRRGELDCLVCSPKVADAGFNWQFCGAQEVGHIIYASLDYLDTTFTQSYRRATRGVRSTPLLITVLIYQRSVDWRVLDIVEKKSEMAAEIDPSRQPINFRMAA